MTVSDHQHHNRHKRLLTVALFGALCFLVIPLSHTNAWRQATTRQPERFTELSFFNPSSVPRTAAPGQTLTPRFVIHNLEGASVKYHYTVRAASDVPGTPPVTVTGAIGMAAGESRTISTPITVPSFTQRAHLSISLRPTTQHIHYWVERTDGHAAQD